MTKLKFIPVLAVLAIAAFGCNGGGSTAANGSPSANPGTPQPSGDAGGEYTLQMNPKEGDTYTYVTKIGGAQPVEAVTAMTVKSVSDSDVVLENKIKSMKINGSESPEAQKIFETLVITTTMDKTGKTKSTEVTGVPDQMKESLKSSGSGTPVGYPDHPVKVGDTWTSETSVQGKSMKLNYKFVRTEDVDGKQAAILEATPEGTTDMKMDGPMTITVELANGMTISAKATMMQGDQKIPFEMSRQ